MEREEEVYEDVKLPHPGLQARFQLGANTLSHRIVMAPMTRMRATEVGMPTTLMGEYYTQRATQGGLLISEGILIDPRGRAHPNTPGIWCEEQVQAWKHAGRVAVSSHTLGQQPLSSSRFPIIGRVHRLLGEGDTLEDYKVPKRMTQRDINNVLARFVEAAQNSIIAGFDGVEIQCGSGYLLDTFIHSNINDRIDGYGGSLGNRLRFPLEVVDAIADAIGNHRTAIRITPFNRFHQTLDSNRIKTFSRFAKELDTRGLAYVHIVEQRYDQPFHDKVKIEGKSVYPTFEIGAGGDSPCCEIRTPADNGYPRDPGPTSLWTFRNILKNTPLIGAGGYGCRDANNSVTEGKVDLVAFGRLFTSNPDLVDRILNNLDFTPYDRSLFYTPGYHGYTDWNSFWEIQERVKLRMEPEGKTHESDQNFFDHEAWDSLCDEWC